MHISDGVLHPVTLAGGFAVGGALAAWGLRKIEDRDYSRVGLMTAAFFAASLIHVPVPPTSVHLTLNSVVGVALGLRCFPAIMMALLLQALLLKHGGVTTLGVNTVVMAVPGFLAGSLMRWGLAKRKAGFLPFYIVLFAVCLASTKMSAEALRATGIVRSTLSWPVAIAIGLVGSGIVAGLERRFAVREGDWCGTEGSQPRPGLDKPDRF